MTIEKCMEFGKRCGLHTLAECVLNIELHATQLFDYDTISEELSELYSDLKEKEPNYSYIKK